MAETQKLKGAADSSMVVHAVVKNGKVLGDTKPHVCIGSSCQEPAKARR